MQESLSIFRKFNELLHPYFNSFRCIKIWLLIADVKLGSEKHMSYSLVSRISRGIILLQFNISLHQQPLIMVAAALDVGQIVRL